MKGVGHNFHFYKKKYFAIDFFTSFLTSSESQSYKDLTKAVSSWFFINNHLLFNNLLPHLYFSYFFQKFSLLTFICFTTHCMLYTMNVYSISLIQRRMVSQMGFPSRFLYPNITLSHRLQNATGDTTFFVLLLTWIESSAYSSVAYICQFEFPRLPSKYPLIHLKIFSRVLQSLGGEEWLCLTWWLACSHESSVESAHAGHFHPSA